jgi:hypothetical protein
MKLQRSRLARSRFAPKLEALEDRNMLSATAVFVPSTGLLTITGTDKADHVKIFDSGSATAPGAVQVFAEGFRIFSSPPVGGSVKSVTNIVVNLGKGKDSLDYQLTGPLAFAQRTLNADLGQGNDLFNANILGNLGFGAKLALNILGNDGNDTMTVSVASDLAGRFFFLPPSSLQISLDGGAGRDVMAVSLNGNVRNGANLSVSLQGGLDNDTMNINALVNVDAGGTMSLAERGQQGNDNESISSFGTVNGTLQTQADGGPGKDRIVTDVFLPFGSTGTLTANEQGGPGDDNLTLLVHDPHIFFHPTINAKVDGGPDQDICHKTSNVIDVNCETTIVVP